jgi:hypothetical protein
VTFEELRREFADRVIGPHWLELVRELCQQTVVSYPPKIYGGTEAWADSLDDLVQDVVTNALLRDHQLEYLLDEARTMSDLRRLLGRQIRHVLARRRTRTVVDQLLERSQVLLRNSPFTQLAAGRNARWALDQTPYEDRSPSPRDLRRAEIVARGLPVVPYSGSERGPIVYREDVLRQLLQGVAETLACSFGLRDLDYIFRNVLTGFLPSVLNGVGGPLQGPPTDPEDASEMTRAATAVYERLDSTQRQVLAAKLCGVSDADVGEQLSMSRPTVAKRKEGTFEVLRMALEGFSDEIREGAVDQLALLLAGTWPPISGGDNEVG